MTIALERLVIRAVVAPGWRSRRPADAAGKPIYLELSSVNPVVVLPGALRERGEELATEFVTSVLMGTGQFCTNPGLVVMLAGAEKQMRSSKL